MMKVDAFAAGHPAIAISSAADLADQVKALPVTHFDAWVQAAQPGARIVYGIGTDAPSASGPGIARRMMKLHDAGLVRLHLVRSRRDGSFPIDFIAVRRAKPVPKGFPELPRPIVPGAGKITTVGGHK
jgi:hypothetical protein